MLMIFQGISSISDLSPEFQTYLTFSLHLQLEVQLASQVNIEIIEIWVPWACSSLGFPHLVRYLLVPQAK